MSCLPVKIPYIYKHFLSKPLYRYQIDFLQFKSIVRRIEFLSRYLNGWYDVYVSRFGLNI